MTFNSESSVDPPSAYEVHNRKERKFWSPRRNRRKEGAGRTKPKVGRKWQSVHRYRRNVQRAWVGSHETSLGISMRSRARYGQKRMKEYNAKDQVSKADGRKEKEKNYPHHEKGDYSGRFPPVNLPETAGEIRKGQSKGTSVTRRGGSFLRLGGEQTGHSKCLGPELLSSVRQVRSWVDPA